jgi:hypothetical protein
VPWYDDASLYYGWPAEVPAQGDIVIAATGVFEGDRGDVSPASPLYFGEGDCDVCGRPARLLPPLRTGQDSQCIYSGPGVKSNAESENRTGDTRVFSERRMGFSGLFGLT